MLYWNEDTQEWEDDGTVEPEQPSDLPTVIEQSPDFEEDQTPPPRLIPTPVYPEEPPTSKMRVAQAMLDREKIPPRPPQREYDPETMGMITGYGQRVMLRKPGIDSGWQTPGGEEAPFEYVKDVQDTIGAVDRGEMSETQLKEKIAGQEGRPPGKKPTDTDLTEMEFLKFVQPEIDTVSGEYGKSVRQKYESKFSYSDLSLMKGSQKIAYEHRLADIEERATNEKRNEMLSSYSYEFRNRKRIEDQKEREKRLEAERDQNRAEVLAARREDAAEKLSEESKIRLSRIKEDRRSLKRDIANNRMLATVSEPAAKNIEMWSDEIKRLEEEEKEIIKGKPTAHEPAPEKTLQGQPEQFVPGKKYSIGDIVIKDGKPVRIKGIKKNGRI